jgi:hypothetical protein
VYAIDCATFNSSQSWALRAAKGSYEHIKRDQGPLLAQVSLLGSAKLPVSGAEKARKLLDQKWPSKITSRTEVKTCQRRGLRHSAMKKMGRAGKCWDEAKKDFKLPKYESMPGYANGLPC